MWFGVCRAACFTHLTPPAPIWLIRLLAVCFSRAVSRALHCSVGLGLFQGMQAHEPPLQPAAALRVRAELWEGMQTTGAP